MDTQLLADLTVQIGYELALSGAETFRIEETMQRIATAYGVECQSYAVPNNVMLSLNTQDGNPIMLMRRVGFHGNDLESLEKLNALSRRICAETPNPAVAVQWLKDTLRERRRYPKWLVLIGHFIVAAGFCPAFGGSLTDIFWAGTMGLIIGLVKRIMDKFEVNPFFSTIMSSFVMAIPAYILAGFGLIKCVDSVIISTLMLLVPGLLITNSMRDIIYGDTNSGIIRIVQVLLSALAIALGTAAAWRVTASVYGITAQSSTVTYSAWVQAIMMGIAGGGFAVICNEHGKGCLLSMFGGVITWLSYLLFQRMGLDAYETNLAAAVIASVYAECIARIRKYPAISYLIISILPLLPGAGIYYTMSIGLEGDLQRAMSKGLETAGIAGCLAIAILLVSSVFRLISTYKARKRSA